MLRTLFTCIYYILVALCVLIWYYAVPCDRSNTMPINFVSEESMKISWSYIHNVLLFLHRHLFFLVKFLVVVLLYIIMAVTVYFVNNQLCKVVNGCYAGRITWFSEVDMYDKSIIEYKATNQLLLLCIR